MLSDGVSKERLVARVKVDGIGFGNVYSRLAFDGGMLAFRMSGDRNGGSSLYVVDIKSGKSTQVALLKSGSEGIGSFAWSPAGRTLAYVRTSPAPDPDAANEAYGTVYLYSAGFQPVRLGGSNGSDRVLAFSSDGLGVYVSRREGSGASELEHLVYLPISGGAGTVIVRSQPNLKYTNFALWVAPGQPAKAVALAEGNFALALAGTSPATPSPTATSTPRPGSGSTITDTISVAVSSTFAVMSPTPSKTPVRTAPPSKVSITGRLSGPGGLGIAVIDPVSAVPYLLRRDAEDYPYMAWTADGKGLLMGGTRTGAAWAVDLNGGERALGTPLTGLSASTWSQDGSMVVLSDSPTSKQVTLDYATGRVVASRSVGSYKPGAAAVSLKVPYIHQVNDTATSGDGNWACGPTSVAMALAYYGKIDPWSSMRQERVGSTAQPGKTPLPTQTPIGADFAPYVTDVYTSNGHIYNAVAADPRGHLLAGLYGTICPTGFASWNLMQSVLQWHGLSSTSVPATWDGIVGALKRGHPVLLGNMLTAAGHIILVTGYTPDGDLVANDPYGNRFEPGYGSNNGQGVLYPWKRVTPRTALEVIGVYPPPSPTATRTATATAIVTATVPATATSTATGAPTH